MGLKRLFDERVVSRGNGLYISDRIAVLTSELSTQTATAVESHHLPTMTAVQLKAQHSVEHTWAHRPSLDNTHRTSTHPRSHHRVWAVSIPQQGSASCPGRCVACLVMYRLQRN